MKLFPLTKEQQEVYNWLKMQKLNTDESTLNYWARKYKESRIKDVVTFAKKRIAEGQKIRNIGGWVHTLLKSDLAVVNEECIINRKLAKKFSEENHWEDLMIYEKYVRDAVTDSDLPLTISRKEFERGLMALYEKSKLYKKL